MTSRWLERFIVRLGISISLGFIIFVVCLYGCIASGQEVARISPAQPPIPPIPAVKITRLTNSEKEVVTVIVQKPPNPPPLVRKSWTNAFWVACTECEQEVIRKPLRIDLITSSPIEDGEQREYAIWFQCCGKEFKSRYVRRVTTPIAVPVQVPSK